MAEPRQIVGVEIAVANHLVALQRDHADDLAGLDPVHPAVDGLIVVHVYHQVVVILAWKRSDEAFEELLILCAQGPENHGHGGFPRNKNGSVVAPSTAHLARVQCAMEMKQALSRLRPSASMTIIKLTK